MKLKLLSFLLIIFSTITCNYTFSQDTDLDGIVDTIDVDDDNDGILDDIECSYLGKIPLLNSDFEDVDIVATGLDGGPTDVVVQSGVWKGDASNIPYWESADTVSNHLEIWQNGNSGTDDVGGVAFSGSQWSEINATSSDGLYQDITTTPGDVLYWSFAHRKRTVYNGSATEDETRLLIGDPSGTLASQGDFSSVNDASWTEHSGTYTVPVGQTTTRLTFTALNTVSGTLTSGNFIDNVQLYVAPNCEESDGDTYEDYLDFDSDNDGIPDNIEAQPTVGYILPSGTVNTSGAYIGLWDNYGTGITPEDTDNDGTPDFLDSDSDNDGIFDIQENGMANGLIGTDTDLDGLDNNFEGGNLNDPLDVNDEIDNPSSSILPDSDFDLGTGGDLDYRDSNPPNCSVGTDSDGDGINDVCDLDDDNDGILDINELGTIISTDQQPCGGDTPLDFSAAPTLLSGPDLLQGAVYRFPNISTGMDAIVTIVETNNATVAELDRNATTPSSFKPRTAFNFTDSGEFGYIEYRIQFVNSGGFIPQIIPKFFMNFNDLDGGTNFGEQNWADNPKTYTIDNPTEITMNTDGSWIVATGAPTDYGPSTNEFPFINFAVNYTNKSEISIRVGAVARVPGVSSSGRSHSIEFNCVTNYVSPQTYSLDGDYDGLANHLDLDSDNDGILDAVESGHGQPHTNGVVNGPYGANGLPDLVETSPGSNTINYVITDTDGIDGSNYLDTDSDNDYCFDALEGTAGYAYSDINITSGQLLSSIDANGVPGGTSQGVGTSTDDTLQSDACITGATIDFDGVDDYVETVNSIIDGLTQYTISFWMNYNGAILTGASESDKVFVLGQKGVFDIAISASAEPENHTIVARLYNSSGGLVGGLGGKFARQDWVHVAVTVNHLGSNTEFQFYRNGFASGIGTVSNANNTNSNPFRMGIVNSPSVLQNFEGWIDEVRIFDAVLSDDQIQRMVNQEIENSAGLVRGTVIGKDIEDSATNATIPWTDLISYYAMNNIKGNKVPDESSFNNEATLYNITTIQPQTAPMPYETAQDGDWTQESTWLHGDVWGIENLPDFTPVNQSYEPYSIVQIHNDVTTSKSHRSIGLFIDTDKILSVTGDNSITNSWYFQLDGTLDLADDSQLIQGINSDLVTSSDGKILRRQEGNLNYYWYNYWSSPVGAPATTTNTNTNFSINMLKDGPGITDFVEFTSAYDEEGKVSNRWLYKYQNGRTYNDWEALTQSSLIEPGVGYTQKGTSNADGEQNYIFEGKPNNGIITLSANDVVGDSADEHLNGPDFYNYTSYLIGNPYPSAIDARLFIEDNGPDDPLVLDDSGLISGTVYVWEQWAGSSHNLDAYEGGYGTINYTTAEQAYQWNDPASGPNTLAKTPTFYIPVGQGFFVEVVADSGDIEFNNSQRVFIKESDADSDPTNNSVFFRTSNQDDNQQPDIMSLIRLELNVSNGNMRRFALGFSESATDGYDYGYDARTIDPQLDDMNSYLDDEKMIIQTFAPITSDKVVDLVFNSTGSYNYTIEMVGIKNIPEDQEIYLRDNLTNTYFDLRSGAYSFSSEVNAEDTERFDIVFKPGETLSNDDFDTNNTLIYVNNPEDKLYVKGLTAQAKQLSITNMLGQTIKAYNNINNQTLENGINISNLSSGVYVVSVKTESNQNIDKKVIIN